MTATIAELDSGEGVLGATLADARTLSALTALSAAEAGQATLFASTGAVHAMDTPEQAETEAEVGELSRTELRSLIGDLLVSGAGRTGS